MPLASAVCQCCEELVAGLVSIVAVTFVSQTFAEDESRRHGAFRNLIHLGSPFVSLPNPPILDDCVLTAIAIYVTIQ